MTQHRKQYRSSKRDPDLQQLYREGFSMAGEYQRLIGDKQPARGLAPPAEPEASATAPPRCTPFCKPESFVHTGTGDGRVRTDCGVCGKFIGYRPES